LAQEKREARAEKKRLKDLEDEARRLKRESNIREIAALKVQYGLE
jgi:hypothetical protein